jgi:hypothetical protein
VADGKKKKQPTQRDILRRVQRVEKMVGEVMRLVIRRMPERHALIYPQITDPTSTIITHLPPWNFRVTVHTNIPNRGHEVVIFRETTSGMVEVDRKDVTFPPDLIDPNLKLSPGTTAQFSLSTAGDYVLVAQVKNDTGNVHPKHAVAAVVG